jgi:hypothetical protein
MAASPHQYMDKADLTFLGTLQATDTLSAFSANSLLLNTVRILVGQNPFQVRP